MIANAIERKLFPQSRGPLIVECPDGCSALSDFLVAYKGELNEKLLTHGAVLFRGFRVADAADFGRSVRHFSDHAMDYTYRSTPRTEVLEKIYTASEYPPPETIPLHNENSYQRHWPSKIAFCCTIPAAEGGETTLADMRLVTREIGQKLVHKFERLQVKYVRHYRPNIDLSWQTVFQNGDKSAVADFCKAEGIEHEWINSDTLRTVQIAQGTAFHPITRETIFFNQAHLFHVSSLPKEVSGALLDIFGEDYLPRNAYFGDGSALQLDELHHIRRTLEKYTMPVKWKKSDVLVVDNMQFAHGRFPFAGKRQVLVSLMDPLHS